MAVAAAARHAGATHCIAKYIVGEGRGGGGLEVRWNEEATKGDEAFLALLGRVRVRH